MSDGLRLESESHAECCSTAHAFFEPRSERESENLYHLCPGRSLLHFHLGCQTYLMFKFTGKPAHASTFLVDSMQDGQISSTSVAYFTEVTCCLGQDSTKAPALYGVLHHHGPTVQTIRDMWKLKVVLPPVSRVNADTRRPLRVSCLKEDVIMLRDKSGTSRPHLRVN